MTGFEPRTSGVGSDPSTIWSTIITHVSFDASRHEAIIKIQTYNIVPNLGSHNILSWRICYSSQRFKMQTFGKIEQR